MNRYCPEKSFMKYNNVCICSITKYCNNHSFSNNSFLYLESVINCCVYFKIHAKFTTSLFVNLCQSKSYGYIEYGSYKEKRI